jgi:fructosamine-3-kinase
MTGVARLSCVDLAYLRAHPEHLTTFLRHQRIRETPVGGGSICRASRLTLEDGESAFVKFLNDPTDETPGTPVPPGFFEAEAAGLTWLRDAGGVAVPEVLAVTPGLLVLEWVEAGPPTAAAAEAFGRDLATTHRAGADAFGAPWAGYIGSLPQPNEPTFDTWSEFFSEQRLRPHLRTSQQRKALADTDVSLVESVLSRIREIAPPAESPARLHGDLWPGNVLWGADQAARLIDPSAHGGHRETDLAELALFGETPYLARIIAAYDEVWPLADGWRARVPLHQLHLLLVHTALFGPAYRDQVVNAARSALAG